MQFLGLPTPLEPALPECSAIAGRSEVGLSGGVIRILICCPWSFLASTQTENRPVPAPSLRCFEWELATRGGKRRRWDLGLCLPPSAVLGTPRSRRAFGIRSLFGFSKRLRGCGATNPRGTADDGREDSLGTGPKSDRPAEHSGEGRGVGLLHHHQPTGADATDEFTGADSEVATEGI
ncbi:uncharacterized protein LOC141750872 isoform X3 [Larus michahellis]|uniref:uncharacterized protein LOC141750872 isoform X3 n=1 Tax=Larus michahellis TaxID=119627 RepID=UPI003D9B4CC2